MLARFCGASQESECKIEIESSRPGENAMRVIRIRGNMQQTQLAQQLITQRVRPLYCMSNALPRSHVMFSSILRLRPVSLLL
jgi:hypothetical protein